ncbi:MAG: DUF4968 domain-containing protein, partial [Anaerolineales bacterium]|nr:DUF4968 domain-containing protein [Anaerolineales bacterium]
MGDLLNKLRLAINSIGLVKIVQTIFYSWKRDRLDQAYLEELNKDGKTLTVLPGELQKYIGIKQGAVFTFENASLEILFLQGDMVRATWTPGKLPVPYCVLDQKWPPVQVEIRNTKMLYSVSSPSLSVFINPDGEISYLNNEGTVLRTESAPELTGTSWSHTAKLRPQEFLFGTGERASGLDLRGRKYQLWNTEMNGNFDLGYDPTYFNIPLYLAYTIDDGYLVYYENSFDGEFDFTEVEKGTFIPDNAESFTPGLAKTTFIDGALRYYFTCGPLSTVTENYTQLTGRHSLPPKWGLGFHQCRWGYRSEDEILEIARGFKDHDLPISVIHLDLDYMDGCRIFTTNPIGFPHFEEMNKQLEEMGIKTVSIIDPGVKIDKKYGVYLQGKTEDVFCKLPDGNPSTGIVWPGMCEYPDFSNPKSRRWWGDLYPRLWEKGVDGFWHDMNEPAAFVAWGESRIPLSTQHDLDGRKGDHRQARNVYGLLMGRAGYEALKEQRPDRRPWILSRSGTAGSQRYTWNWTGDINSSWSALRMTVAMVLNLGLSGIAFTGPDTGGFSKDPTPELHMRWFQLSTFL